MDPVSSIAFGAGQLFGFLDSVIYSPQERQRDQLTAEGLEVQRRQIQSQERLAMLSAQQAQQTRNTVLALAIIGGAVALGVVILR
jgi:hypothetical protein